MESKYPLSSGVCLRSLFPPLHSQMAASLARSNAWREHVRAQSIAKEAANQSKRIEFISERDRHSDE